MYLHSFGAEPSPLQLCPLKVGAAVGAALVGAGVFGHTRRQEMSKQQVPPDLVFPLLSDTVQEPPIVPGVHGFGVDGVGGGGVGGEAGLGVKTGRVKAGVGIE